MAKQKHHRRHGLLDGLGEYPPLASPKEIRFNKKHYVCYGRPVRGHGKGRRYLKPNQMDAVVCVPRGSTGARVLTDAEVEAAKRGVRSGRMNAAVHEALRAARISTAARYRALVKQAIASKRAEALKKARAARSLKADRKGKRKSFFAGKRRGKAPSGMQSVLDRLDFFTRHPFYKRSSD